MLSLMTVVKICILDEFREHFQSLSKFDLDYTTPTKYIKIHSNCYSENVCPYNKGLYGNYFEFDRKIPFLYIA